MPKYVNIQPGEPGPWFHARTNANPRYAFDTTGGRYLVLCFFGSAADPHSCAAIEAVYSRPDLFNDAKASWFGVSIDPSDEAEQRVGDRLPGHRVFWDFDGAVSRLYGAAPIDEETPDPVPLRRLWAVLDPTFRVIAAIPFAPDRSDIAELVALIESLPPADRFAGRPIQAPILFLPRVFEPELCARLIQAYENGAPADSGFMREVAGKTVLTMDYGHKRRSDVILEDPELISALQLRIRRRIVPEIRKVHQFEVTRMERNIVACYAAEQRGHFQPHRDNTTKGTAHRRFAVSVNLNEDYDGGEVWFPEYGPQAFKPPAGGAVVFSCSLLHAVRPLTRGRRYVFLPFLYDEAAAQQREANGKFVAGNHMPYRAAADAADGKENAAEGTGPRAASPQVM